MAQLIPVDHDPFAEPQTGAPKLVPVDHDPFASKEEMGGLRYAEGVAQAVAKGTTFGFGDEIAATFGSLFGLGPRLLGTKGYDEILQDVRGRETEFAEQYPKTALAAEIAGGVAMPAAGAKTALKAGQTFANLTKTGRIGQLAGTGAAIGAPYGALYEVGTAETSDPSALIGAAGRGALIGGTAGAVLQPAGAAAVPIIEGGAKATAAALRKLTGGSIQGNLAPEAAAADRVARALAEDADIAAKAGSPTLSDDAYNAAIERGQPVMPMDLGGATTRGVARAAANTSGPAREILETATDARFAGQGDRMAEYLRKLGEGRTNAHDTREALQAEARTIRTPMYQQAYREGADGIDDHALIQLSSAPAMKSALDEARIRLANRNAVEGNTTKVEDRIGGKNGLTLEYYDAAKQALDDKINTLLGRGENGAAREYIGIRDKLVSILDDKVPSYADARGTASTYFGASDALTAGERFATGAAKFENDAARDALAKMTPRERELFGEGFVSQLVGNAMELKDRRNIANILSSSSAARDRVAIALGSEKAAQLEAQMRIESVMELGRKAVSGNSTTARQLMELGLIPSAGVGYSAYSGDPTAMLIAGAIGGRRLAMNSAERRMAEEIARLLTKGDPASIRQAAEKVASSGQLNALRALDRQLERAGIWPVIGVQQSSASKDKKQAPDPLAKALRSMNTTR